MSAEFTSLLDLLDDRRDESPRARRQWSDLLAVAMPRTGEQLAQLLERIAALDSDAAAHGCWRLVPLLDALRRHLTRLDRAQAAEIFAEGIAGKIAELAGRHHDPATRGGLLCLLAASRQGDALALLAEQMAAAPPEGADQATLVLVPLFQRTDYDPRKLFPRVLDAVTHSQAAAAILDLANFTFRESLLERHPAEKRQAELAGLLGGLVEQLERLEEGPPADAEDPQALARGVQEGIALAISLCDALALIGDRSAMGKLNRAMELRHRRLRTEAAAALARLGDEAGRRVLLELAAEPIARRRVIAYAQELGLADQVPPEHATSAALAEADLALWLAEPAQFGTPPSEMSLLDSRSLYWPGYEELVECFLFQYVYHLPGGTLANVGIAGPLVHALAADLTHLPPETIYAAYTGWHAKHPDIGQVRSERFDPQQSHQARQRARNLAEAGFQSIVPLLLGRFFEYRVLVARAARNGQEGIAVSDDEEQLWFPEQERGRPIGAAEAYCIYKGRKLLEQFNA